MHDRLCQRWRVKVEMIAASISRLPPARSGGTGARGARARRRFRRIHRPKCDPHNAPAPGVGDTGKALVLAMRGLLPDPGEPELSRICQCRIFIVCASSRNGRTCARLVRSDEQGRYTRIVERRGAMTRGVRICKRGLSFELKFASRRICGRRERTL